MSADRPPRIAFYIPLFLNGGIERFVCNIAEEMASRGLIVDILMNQTTPMVDNIPETANVLNLSSHSLLSVFAASSLVSPDVASAFRSLPAYVDYLRKYDPNMVVVMRTSPAGIGGVRLAQSDAKVIVRESNTPSIATANPTHAIGRLAPTAKKLFYPLADKVVGVSAGVARDLQEWLDLPKEQITYIYNPTYNKAIEKRAMEPVEHPWFADRKPTVGMTDKEPYLLVSVGRFADQKDFATLLRAFAQVRKERSVQLALIGDGDNRSRLEQLATYLDIMDDVAFVGHVMNPYKYVSRSDLFILSSYFEGLPNVLIEAIGVGTPAIATDCPSGPREILLDGAGGTLVPVEDTEALAKAITSLLDDSDRAERELRRARDELNRFTPEQVVDEYLELAIN